MRSVLTTIWYVLTLRCEEADRIRSIAQKEDLSRAQRFGAWSHALVCRGCWVARKQADKLEALVSDLSLEERSDFSSDKPGLSGDQRERLSRAIRANTDQ